MMRRHSDSARSSTPDGITARTTRHVRRDRFDPPGHHHADNTSTPVATDPDQRTIEAVDTVDQLPAIAPQHVEIRVSDQPSQQQSP